MNLMTHHSSGIQERAMLRAPSSSILISSSANKDYDVNSLGKGLKEASRLIFCPTFILDEISVKCSTYPAARVTLGCLTKLILSQTFWQLSSMTWLRHLGQIDP
jgi:hypothetical protein